MSCKLKNLPDIGGFCIEVRVQGEGVEEMTKTVMLVAVEEAMAGVNFLRMCCPVHCSISLWCASNVLCMTIASCPEMGASSHAGSGGHGSTHTSSSETLH